MNAANPSLQYSSLGAQTGLGKQALVPAQAISAEATCTTHANPKQVLAAIPLKHVSKSDHIIYVLGNRDKIFKCCWVRIRFVCK